MSRLVTVTVRSLSLFLGLAGLAAAQEPPPLEPPSLEPPRAGTSPARTPTAGPKPVVPQPVAPTPPAAIRPTPPKPENRPMLAIPGVTAPASRPPAAFRPPVAGPIAPANLGVRSIARRLAVLLGLPAGPVVFGRVRIPPRRASVVVIAR